MGYYEDVLFSTGLVGYWRFGESNADAGVVAEFGPTGIFPATRPNLTQAGAIVGDTDTCYRWAASNNDYIYWGGSTYTFGNRAAFSLEIWYQPTTLAPTTGYMNLISKDRYDADASGYGLYLSNANKRLYFTRVSYQSGVVNTTGPIVEMGKWYHIVCVYDGYWQLIFSNGELVGGSPAEVDMSVSTSTPLYLGRSAQAADDYLSAWMDEFAIYNRPLTNAEIQDHYNSGANPVVPEYGGANAPTKFIVYAFPDRLRLSGSSLLSSSDTSLLPQRETRVQSSFDMDINLVAEGNVYAFPTHSMAMSSSMQVAPVRQRPASASARITSLVTARMPMTFKETHTFVTRASASVTSAVRYTSNTAHLATRFPLSMSGMTRLELDELFRIATDQRSGAIHYAVSRLTRGHVTVQHPHSNTLDPETQTPFVALDAEGIPKVAGTATVQWYISRIIVDATNRVYERPDVLEYFSITDEVAG